MKILQFLKSVGSHYLRFLYFADLFLHIYWNQFLYRVSITLNVGYRYIGLVTIVKLAIKFICPSMRTTGQLFLANSFLWYLLLVGHTDNKCGALNELFLNTFERSLFSNERLHFHFEIYFFINIRIWFHNIFIEVPGLLVAYRPQNVNILSI